MQGSGTEDEAAVFMCSSNQNTMQKEGACCLAAALLVAKQYLQKAAS